MLHTQCAYQVEYGMTTLENGKETNFISILINQTLNVQ